MTEHVTPAFSWEKDHNAVRRNLIREMNRLGIARLEGSYSGGHDEGGLEGELKLYDKKGKPIEHVIPEGKHSWELPLYQAVEELLSTKFYSWALECSVYGQVYVDLTEKRAWTEGQEEVMEYREDFDPIDMRW